MDESTLLFRDTTGRLHSRLGATSMEDYQRCPRYWHYRPRYAPLGLPAPWTTMGSAVHAGLAAFYQDLVPTSSTKPTQNPTEVGLHYLRTYWQECAELDLAGAEPIITKGIAAGIATPVMGVPLAVEEVFTDCTVDLVVGVKDTVEVWDFKWKHRLDDEWVSKTMSKTRHMSQLYHNAWRVGQAMPGIPISAIGQGMISFLPKPRVRYYRHEMSLKRLTHWWQSHQIWRERAIQDEQHFRDHHVLPPMNFHACDDYGGCPYQGICLEKDGDEANLGMAYQVLSPGG